jgi:hypothetical protein
MAKRSLAVMAFLVIAVPAFSQTGARAKDASLQAAIEARQKAVDTRNATEWARYTTDDFEFVSAEGLISNRAERMKGLTTSKTAVQSVTIDSVRMLGPDLAVMVQRVGGNRMSLIWQRQGDTWKVAAGQSTPIAKK